MRVAKIESLKMDAKNMKKFLDHAVFGASRAMFKEIDISGGLWRVWGWIVLGKQVKII